MADKEQLLALIEKQRGILANSGSTFSELSYKRLVLDILEHLLICEERTLELDSGFSLADWRHLSKSGKVCGIVGCLAETPYVQCDHCGNHYCNDHKWVIGTPLHQKHP